MIRQEALKSTRHVTDHPGTAPGVLAIGSRLGQEVRVNTKDPDQKAIWRRREYRSRELAFV
jgi:hypothetical protein